MNKLVTIVLSAFCFATPLLAQSKTLLNLDKTGVALQGHDPVAFLTDKKPMQGSLQFVSRYKNATYLFVSKEHKELFDKHPEKYEPAFGGYCAYGVSRNKLVEIDVDAFQIVNGRLLLQYSKGVRSDFNKDLQNNLMKADSNWPRLVEGKGKS
jgi:YHS domain-containing protein